MLVSPAQPHNHWWWIHALDSASVVLCSKCSLPFKKLFSNLFSSLISCFNRCIAQLEKHYSTVTSITFNKDASLLFSAGRDSVVTIWKLDDYSVERTLPVFEVSSSKVTHQFNLLHISVFIRTHLFRILQCVLELHSEKYFPNIALASLNQLVLHWKMTTKVNREWQSSLKTSTQFLLEQLKIWSHLIFSGEYRYFVDAHAHARVYKS